MSLIEPESPDPNFDALEIDYNTFITILTNMIQTCLEINGKPRLGGQIGCCDGTSVKWYDTPSWAPEGFKLGIEFYIEATGNIWDPYHLKIRRITSVDAGGSIPIPNPNPAHPDNQEIMTQFAKELLKLASDQLPEGSSCTKKLFKVVVKCDKNNHTVITKSPNPFVPPFN